MNIYIYIKTFNVDVCIFFFRIYTHIAIFDNVRYKMAPFI